MNISKRIAQFVNSWLMDAANPRERAQRPFERTTAGDFHQEINPTDRVRLLSDSRKLFSNVGPAKAAIVDKSVYSIGRAWAPKFCGQDKEWGRRATEYLTDRFYPLCDIGASGDLQTQLYLASISIDRDGDVGIMLTEDSEGNPRIQLVPAHMIGSRFEEDAKLARGPYRGLRQIDGVVINDFSQPVAYCILGADKDGKEDRWISARDFVFLFEPEWIGQLRGLPCFTHAILDLRDLRTVQGYERLASQIASSIGLIEHNETGMPDLNDPASLLRGGGGGNAAPSEMVAEDRLGGLVKYFRAGSNSKLELLKNERPGQAWESFMNRLIRNAYAGAGWPYELSWDSAALGGANIRLIVSKAMRAVEDRQDLIRPTAKRVAGYACAKAIKKGDLPMSADWWRWEFAMPQKLTVDYGRDAKAQRDDYLANIINLGDILAERGGTLEAHIEARKAENAALAAAGLPVPGASVADPADPIVPEDPEDPAEVDAEQKGGPAKTLARKAAD